MTNADKKTLRARLVKLAQLAKKKTGSDTRYWFVARTTTGGSGVVPVTGTPNRKAWDRVAAQLAPQMIMMAVVDVPSGRVLFEYVTPQWSTMTAVPGIKEHYQAQLQAFKGMVLPWAS